MALINPTHRDRSPHGRDVFGIPIRAFPNEDPIDFIASMGTRLLTALLELEFPVNETEADCLLRGEIYEAARAFHAQGLDIYTGNENRSGTRPLLIIAMKQRRVNEEHLRDNSRVFAELVLNEGNILSAADRMKALANIVVDNSDYPLEDPQWVKIYE